ncbi:MAG: hypothetical protein WBM35_13475 [Candidatus Electrothrix sp.]
MDKDIIEGYLGEHLKTLYNSIVNGFEKAIPVIRAGSRIYDQTTKSAIIRDFIVKEAQKDFQISFFEKKGKLTVLYIENVIIRFKKLNNRLLAGNVPTHQSKKFSNQNNLPGFSSPTINLNAGYLLNEDGYSIRSVYLTKPKTQYENDWVLNVGKFVENNLAIPIPPLQKLTSMTPQSSGLKVSVKESAKEMIRKKNVSNE